MNNYTLQIFLFSSIFILSCREKQSTTPSIEFSSFPEKEYKIDEFGQIITSESDIAIDDFTPASQCASCHQSHYDEWSNSMHAYAMKDPLFFSGWNYEKGTHGDIGERFCIQCHSPVAFVTGKNLHNINTAEDLVDSGTAEVILEGIGCDFCHSVTGPSSTIHTPESGAAVAEYHLYPGENTKYGSIENPQQSEGIHQSEYNPLFRFSESCLPCHDMTVRGVDVERTYGEWDAVPQFKMGGGTPCQECHMPIENRQAASGGPIREVHRHTFVGVDLDLSIHTDENPQYDAVASLLENAITLEFGNPNPPYDSLHTSLYAGDSLIIPITISNIHTGHSFPSGVSFAREAWLEAIVINNEDSLFLSGFLTSNTMELDITDPSLLLFTSYLIGENPEDTISSVSDAHDIINNTLSAFDRRTHFYRLEIPENMTGEIVIQLRMLFRSIKPALILAHPDCIDNENCDLLNNLPIFEMDSIIDTVYIQSAEY